METDSLSIDYEMTALITWAQQIKFIVPEEIIPNIVCNDDNINPKRLKSFQTIILAMAVTKYGYIPYSENSATGTKSGSISSDVENLAGLLRDKLPEKFGGDLSFYIKPDIVKNILDEAVSKLLD